MYISDTHILYIWLVLITVNTEMSGRVDGIYPPYSTAGERLVDMVDCNGWTPLHYACIENNRELIEQLMEAGADIWARYFFDSLNMNIRNL